jgi:hypothetical protein
MVWTSSKGMRVMTTMTGDMLSLKTERRNHLSVKMKKTMMMTSCGLTS